MVAPLVVVVNLSVTQVIIENRSCSAQDIIQDLFSDVTVDTLISKQSQKRQFKKLVEPLAYLKRQAFERGKPVLPRRLVRR
jgi:hypothetical protein